MKTNRNQLKYPIGLQLLMFLQTGINTCPYSFFMRLKNIKKKTNKIQLKIAKQRCRSLKAILALKICSIAPSSNNDNVLCDLLFMRLGNK